MTDPVPEKPSLEGVEDKWAERWEREGTYRFDRSKTRDEVYSIDTPPPTVSGSLHVGHVFSYTHTDLMARFKRMNGKEVFYPMGWDDNGLATERRVQNYYGVRCDPTLPYDPDLPTPQPVGKDEDRPPLAISRSNFIELCDKLTVEDEKVFEALWRKLGLSVDWSMTYSTVSRTNRRVSQRAFLRNIARGQAYQSEAPTVWDVDFNTAIAQAELEDREVPGAYHRIVFHGLDDSRDVEIETTRPELLPSCVALVAHPDDERYKSLFGKEVTTPLFGVRVPVLAHELAEPEKGSGIAMICTFGDTTDVTWWRELRLPARTVIQRDGRFGELTFALLPTDEPEQAQALYGELEGLKIKQAQKKIVELLQASGELVGEPRPIKHAVKFYEKGERPVEIVSSRQWFIRVLDARERFLERGREINWHPSYMRTRYEDWINGLNGDWLVSRQRYFGVPFPVWYKLDDEGLPIYDDPILAHEDSLPVDPASDAPPGYDESRREQPGGFIGDPDIMDTWATSSLTPQSATGWAEDDDLASRTFPMDLRPQAHDIIRTWLFYTVVRAEYENGTVPWHDTALSGWVLDPDRKKMSKSKGNVVTPSHFLDEHGSDAIRYWSANGRPGTDTAFDVNQMKVGRRLSIKVLNASKFVLSFPEPSTTSTVPTEAVDLALLARLAKTIDEATAGFEAYDYTKALERVEVFFWSFCDDYLELVKGRAYGARGNEAAASALLTLRIALQSIQRLFAPFLPFVTEEVWSWWQEGSIHRRQWPTRSELPIADDDDAVLSAAKNVLDDVRRAKSDAKVSQRAAVARVTVTAEASTLALVRQAEADLREVGSIAELVLLEGPAAVSVELADQDAT